MPTDTFDQLSSLQDQMSTEQKQQFDTLNAVKKTPRRINYPAALDFFGNTKATPDEVLGGAQEFAKSHMGANSLEEVYGVGKVPTDHTKIASDFAGIVKPYVNLDSVVYQTAEKFNERTLEEAEKLAKKSAGKVNALSAVMSASGPQGIGRRPASVESRALVENAFRTEDFIDEAQESLLKEDRLASVMGISNGLSPETLHKARLSAFLAEDTGAVTQIAASVPLDERADFAALIQLSTPAEHNVLKYFAGEEISNDIIRAGQRAMETYKLNDGKYAYNPIPIMSALERGLGRDALADLFTADKNGGFGPDSFSSDESREAVRAVLVDYAAKQDPMGAGVIRLGDHEPLVSYEEAADQLLQTVPASFAEARQFLEVQNLDRDIQNALRPRRPDEIGLLFDMTAATMEIGGFTAGTALASSVGGPAAGFLFAFSAQKDSIQNHYQTAGFDPVSADLMSSAILVPISALEYLGASRFFKAGLGKGLLESTGRNYWRISGQLLAQRGVGFAEEILTEGGQRFLEDVVLVAAQEYADIEGLTMAEVMTNAGEEMKAAVKGMAGLMLVPGGRDQGALALHAMTQGRASVGEVGAFLDIETAMQSFGEQRQGVIDRHKLETDEEGRVVLDVAGPDGEEVAIPAGTYDAWKAAGSQIEKDALVEQSGVSAQHLEILQERENELQKQAQAKISEIAFNTAVELESKRAQKVTQRIQSRLDDGLTKDQVLAELIEKYAPGENFNVVSVNTVEDLLGRDDVSESDKATWTAHKERTGKWPPIEGFVSNGTAFLISDNLSSPATAVAKFAHEALGHLGVDAQENMREDVLIEAATILEEGGFLQAWGQMLVNLNPEFYGPQFTTDGKMDPLKLADEVIARIAEAHINGRDLSVQQKNVWQKIRDTTGKMLGIETAAEWTDRSMAELVTGLMRGGRNAEPAVAAGTRFSAMDVSSPEQVEIAEAGGFTLGLKGERWYHRTDATFNTFNKDLNFFSPDENFAGLSGDVIGSPSNMRVALRPGKVFDILDHIPEMLEQGFIVEDEAAYLKEVDAYFEKGERNEDADEDLWAMGDYELVERESVQSYLRENGYDSFKVRENGTSNLGVYGRGNVKLAQEPTYDDEGNVIPIDQRFDSSTPDIRFSVAAAPDTAEFKEWFGESKVQDEDGEPLKVHHGGPETITTFSERYAGETTADNEHGAFYFSDSKNVANDYSLESIIRRYQDNPVGLVDDGRITQEEFDELEEGGVDWYQYVDEYANNNLKVVDAYLKMENPFTIDANFENLRELEQRFNVQDALGFMKGNGVESIPEEFLESARFDPDDIANFKEEIEALAREDNSLEEDEDIEDWMVESATRDFMEEQGYEEQYPTFDGLVIQNVTDDIGAGSAEYQTVYIALDPNQVKSVAENNGSFSRYNDDIRYSVDKLGFYSPIAAAVEAMDFKQIPAKSLADRIKKLPKQEEMIDIGLYDWLELQTGKVRKEEVLAFIEGGGVQINETVLGGSTFDALIDQVQRDWLVFQQEMAAKYDPEQSRSFTNILQNFMTDDEVNRNADFAARIGDLNIGKADEDVSVGSSWDAADHPNEMVHQIYTHPLMPGFQIADMDSGFRVLRDNVTVGDGYESLEDAVEAFGDDIETPKGAGGVKPTQHENESYQLPGPSENYREFILTLPIPAAKKFEIDHFELEGDIVKVYRAIGTNGERLGIGATEEEARTNTSKLVRAQADRGVYTKPSHWSGIDNPIVHFRSNDRLVDGEKALFLEEIQSDWIQDGRKRGFIGEGPLARTSDQIQVDIDARMSELGLPDGTAGGSVAMADQKIREFMAEIANPARVDQVSRDRNAIPDPGALKRSGTVELLAFKRALAIAVKEGHESIAWTPALIQIQRWSDDLQQEVSAIDWSPRGGFAGELTEQQNILDSRLVSLDETRKLYEKTNAAQAEMTAKRASGELDDSLEVQQQHLRLGASSEAIFTTLRRLEDGVNETRQAIDTIQKAGTGEFVTVELHSGLDTKLFYDQDGIVRRVSEERMNGAIGMHLKDVFDNHIAKQILGEETGRLEGSGLTIGGKGFKDLYDRSLVKAVNKYLKPMGGKVGSGKADGHPEGWAIVNASTGEYFGDEVYDSESDAQIVSRQNGNPHSYENWNIAHVEETGTEVWNVPITGHMRSVISKGQPRYSVGAQLGSTLLPGDPVAGEQASSVHIFRDTASVWAKIPAGTKKASVLQLGQALDDLAQELGHARAPNDYGKESLKQISDAMVADVMQQLEQDDSGLGWYDLKTRSAMEMMSRLHPELADDPAAQLRFKVMVAITSQGNTVDLNFDTANAAYIQWKESETLPQVYPGKSGDVIKTAMHAMMDRIDVMGAEAVLAELQMLRPVRDWKALGYKVNGEMMESQITGAMAILGSKIGSFFGNLNGDFSTLTADLWFSRTWNRYTGNMVKHSDYALEKKKALKALAGYKNTKLLHGFKRSEIRADDDTFRAWMSAVVDNYAKGNYKDKNPLNVRMNTIFKNVSEELQGIPRGGRERAAMRDAAKLAQEKLIDHHGVVINTADLQAILWYNEKDLFSLFGATTAVSEKTNYETAAQRIVRAAGLDDTVDDQFKRTDDGTAFGGAGPDAAQSDRNSRLSIGASQGAATEFRLPDPQRDASIDFAVKLLNGDKINKERAQGIIDRMYPGANATSALFAAHGLKKQLDSQWETVRGESLTEAYQLLARTETAMSAQQKGLDVIEDARRRFEEQYLKGTKDKDVRDAAEARRREQAEKDNALTRDELESEGLWIEDPVAQLDIPEETLKPHSEGEEDETDGADQQEDVTDREIEEVTEVPQQINEYLQNLRDAIQVKTGMNTSSPDFLRAYRATLQQAMRGSIRALTYSRARESLLKQVDRLGDLTQLKAIEDRASKILFKTFQSAAHFDRQSLVRQLEKRVRKAIGKRKPKVTGTWNKNKLDAAVDRYFRKVRSTKFDIVEEDSEGNTPAGRKLMDLDLDTVSLRIDMIQNELDTGLEAYYKNEHERKTISDKIAEMQEDLELLQRYGGLKYKTLAEIQEVFDTTEMELDEALRIQTERRDIRNEQMAERAGLIISAVSAARGKLKRTKLAEAKDEWTAYELSVYGRLQDLIRFSEKSDPKVYKALWNKDVVINEDKGIDELWSLSKLARDIDTASHGIRVRKYKAHEALLEVISRLYGTEGKFKSEGVIHELLKVRNEYAKYSKADNPVPLSKAHLIQFIAYMDQEWYRENAELHGRMADYDAIKAELTSEDLRLLDWMRSFYAQQRPELSDKKKQITGLGFPTDSDPLYMPVSVKNYSGGLAGIHTSLQITPAIMTDRRRHKLDINENLDVFAVFFDRVHQNAVYLELAETALDVAEMFGRKDIQESISKIYGDKYKDRLYEHLYDVISQKPLTYRAKGTEKFMLAYGAMVMNFNMGPAARQPSSGFAFAFDHGMGEVAGWQAQWLSPGAAFNPDHKEFIADMLNSDQAAARFEGGASYEMAAMFEAEGVTAIRRIFKKYGMAPNKYVDMITISYIGSHVYRKYYEQLVAQGSSVEAAKELAMDWTWSEVERHQQSSFLQNQAPWQRRGGGAQKLFGMFGTTVQQFLAEQNRVIRRAEATGDYRELVKYTFVNHVILPISYKILDTLFWAMFGRPPDEDEWKEYLALVVMGPLGGKFIFRTIMSYAVDSMIQGRPPMFKDNLVPASGMLRIIGDVTQLAWNTDDPEKLQDLILDITGSLLPPVRLMGELYDNYLSDED